MDPAGAMENARSGVSHSSLDGSAPVRWTVKDLGFSPSLLVYLFSTRVLRKRVASLDSSAFYAA